MVPEVVKYFLNLGCGTRFHPEWTNLDIQPSSASVRRWDLQKELPFPDESFDLVYHSHVLEHFSKADGLSFLQRCLRVLRRGGIIRVAVPDLERIARLYIEALDKSLNGDPVWRERYEWILLEMYDQTVRNYSGGEMLAYMQRDPMPEREFVAARMGCELTANAAPPPKSASAKGRDNSLNAVRGYFSRRLARLALGPEGLRAYDMGRFRLSGEIHSWMYDRYSLAALLERVGFSSPRQVQAAESTIPGWSGYNLDTQPDGSVYKPDSLYMEALRP
jgi:predicted SAM-dependent methyltransferase